MMKPFASWEVIAVLGFFGLAAASGQAPPALRTGKFAITDADRGYWAFQPVKPPALPRNTRHATRDTRPIDAFVLARLEEKKLQMNPPATPRELVRRASFDLLGLPPTPEEVAAFEKTPRDTAWEQLIDRTLMS
jgi:hypothetical protein